MNDIFKEYRFNDKHHLGIGDIRLTIAQQDEINEATQALLRVARAARDVHEDAYFSEEGGPHYLVDVKYIQLLGDTLEEVEGLLK